MPRPQPESRTNLRHGASTVCLPRDDFETVLTALDLTYEAVVDAAEEGLIDFGTAGEPLVGALVILRRAGRRAAA